MSTPKPLLATAPSERINVLDSLRGFALFGVCMVNYAMMNNTLANQTASALTNPWLVTDSLTRWTALFIQFFGVGKFYTIFSFLFGLGFYLFISRNTAKGLDAKKLFIRRLSFLLLFGLLHFALVWHGDILHTYAWIGFALIPFLKASKKKVKAWGIGLLIFYILTIASLMLLSDLMTLMKFINVESMGTPFSVIQQADAIYNTGTYLEQVGYRLSNELPTMLSNEPFLAAKILGMFLLGLYAAMNGTFKNLAENVKGFKKTLAITAPLGILLSLLVVGLQSGAILKDGPFNRTLTMTADELAHILLALTYISALALLVHKGLFKGLFKALGAVGRMALTNYLVQCIIGAFVFYGHGLGLMYDIQVEHGLILTLAVFSLQIVFSLLWFKRYTYGPFEYLWRSLTYSGNAIKPNPNPNPEQ